jgi:type II pantothenate kinase
MDAHTPPMDEDDYIPGTDGVVAMHKLYRSRTNTAEIDNTINHPGSVKINVQGAFIADHEPSSPGESPEGGAHTKDIRLPNHTAVVSHIAVDVSTPLRLAVDMCAYV